MKTSKIILGTVQFGLLYGINNVTGKPDEQKVFGILDHAFNHGIFILDTADAYGNASDLIGNYHKTTGNHFIINTKFRADAEHSIAQQLEDSLRRLNVKSINVYFFHRFQDVHEKGVMEELKALKRAGLIQKTGASVYDNEELAFAIESEDIDVIQLPFNLLDNNSQRGTLLEKARQQQKEIQVRSVFLQGLFFKDPATFPNGLQPLQPYMQQIHSLASEWRITMEEMAIGYVMNQAAIDHVLLGVDTLEQLKTNIAHASKQLPGEVMNFLDKLHVHETALLYPKNWS